MTLMKMKLLVVGGKKLRRLDETEDSVSIVTMISRKMKLLVENEKRPRNNSELEGTEALESTVEMILKKMTVDAARNNR